MIRTTKVRSKKTRMPRTEEIPKNVLEPHERLSVTRGNDFLHFPFGAFDAPELELPCEEETVTRMHAGFVNVPHNSHDAGQDARFADSRSRWIHARSCRPGHVEKIEYERLNLRRMWPVLCVSIVFGAGVWIFRGAVQSIKWDGSTEQRSRM